MIAVRLALAACSLSLAAAAFAAEETASVPPQDATREQAVEPQCFVREFDQSHLRVTPGQQVRRIAVELSPVSMASDVPGRRVTLWLQGRGHRQPYAGAQTCRAQAPGQLDCASTCAPGRYAIDLSSDGQGALLRIVSPRLTVGAACGTGAARPAGGYAFAPRASERLFQLRRAPASVCRAMQDGGAPRV